MRTFQIASGRSQQRYLRFVSRNDCFNTLYNDPMTRLIWMLPARFALYFRMRRGWKIRDPWGGMWLLREFVAGLPDVLAHRRPVSRRTLADVADAASGGHAVCWNHQPSRRDSTMAERRLLTIGHSYVVANNRRLAHEMAVQGNGRWSVTAVSPEHFRGDMREIALEPIAGEASVVRRAAMRVRSNSAFDVVRQRQTTPERRLGSWCTAGRSRSSLAAAQIARAASPTRERSSSRRFRTSTRAYPWPLSAFERHVLTPGGRVDRVRGDRARDDGEARGPATGETVARHPARRRHQRIRARPCGRPTDSPAARLVREDASGRVRGAVRSGKGTGDALTAALAASNAPWRALLVGGGPLEGDLRRFAAAHPGRVQVVTGVPHGDDPAMAQRDGRSCARRARRPAAGANSSAAC